MSLAAPKAPKQQGKGRQWTQEEIGLIRTGYRNDRMSLLELATALGATPSQVSYQINKLGIRNSTVRRPWTNEEDEVLIRLMPTKTAISIARTMNRTINAVTARAARLGINRRDRDGWYTLLETCEILGREHGWLTKRIENGSMKATRRHPDSKSNHWHIKRKDLRDFIRRYPEELIGRNVDLVQMVEILSGVISPDVRAS